MSDKELIKRKAVIGTRFPLFFLLLLFLVTAAGCHFTTGFRKPEGIWYEQNENGDVLEISGQNITVTAYDGRYSFAEKCRFIPEGGVTRIETEDYYVYEDMSYDPGEDKIIAYTMSHTDGDGGHHYTEFLRTKYTPPPAPVYDPPEDHSDPEAVKEFEDLTIRSMKVAFYDAGMPHDVSSSMAMEPPYPDDYTYDLRVLEDGTALVSSSYCQEIELPAEKVDELQKLVEECDLGQINGVDIHTKGLPYGSPAYEAEIELASGEIIRSSANGESVPAQWTSFQKQMHHLLFWSFVDAGYNYYGGEFHSTKPMKRVQSSEVIRQENTGITEEEVYITPDWKKAYDYSLDTHYFVFSDPENRYPVLMRTLNRLSEQYKKTAEEYLQKDYEMMEAVPKSVWKKVDRKYCYSLYAVDHWEMSGKIFSFTVSEGHSNSLGAGRDGYGRYRYFRYQIDMETGEILTLADLFVSPEAISNYLTEKMVGRYGTHNEIGRRVHAEDFPDALAEAVTKPEPEGIGWTADKDRLTLWMPLSMFPSTDSQVMEIIYYDELQELLSEKYTEVW